MKRPWRRRNGLSTTPEYFAWRDMLYRCNNPRSKAYRTYGGRGIKVCERWFDFPTFLADMGPRPGDGYSIERIDNNGNYEPSNCKWATWDEQIRNKRKPAWTPEENERLKALCASGASFPEAAEKVGRTKAAVSGHAQIVGIRSGKPRLHFNRDVAYERELLEAFEAIERAKGYL